MTERAPSVFTVPPGTPFVDAIAAGVMAEAGDDPMALGRYRILVPTRRAARALADAFLRRSAGRPLLLPRLAPLGDIDEAEFEFAFDEAPGLEAGEELPPAISALRRRLLLARQIGRLSEVTTREPMDSAAAARLAGELARLLDQIQTQRLGFDGLARLAPERYARHWQVTLDFLAILTDHWPRILAAEGAIDPADRRNRLLDALAALWRLAPPGEPVIAAGTTGSIPATADLLAVVARLPRGRVVLPGLDRECDDESWAALTPSHPQYGLARLLDRLEVRRDHVRDWPAPDVSGTHMGRARLVSEAMRPAATTAAWRDIEGLPTASSRGLVRVDCPTPREEAAVIALMMREALETPARTAALIATDRALARRVAAELRRWDIEIDDSAGQPLSRTPVGSFLRLTAALVDSGAAPVPLLAALKHPFAAAGRPPAAFRALVRRLERAVLRGPRPAPGLDGLAAALAERGAPDLEPWLGGLARLAAPFQRLFGAKRVRLETVLQAHIGFAEALAATGDEAGADRLWAGEDGEAAAAFIAELRQAARGHPALPADQYAPLLETLLAGIVVRPRWGRHPRLAIWGTLEARLQDADLLILGGLNEGGWPPEPAPDPWMSRPMRETFGLPALERRIGLSAHDFAQALAAREVVLTRSERVDGVPTVPSRWLLRLETVLRGADLLPDLEAAGAWPARHWLAWQAALDTPARLEHIPPPAPVPPLDARPRTLSVTEVGTLMRDPYAIYARRILGLRPLDPIDADPGAAERGTAIHDALDRFLRAHPGPPPADALDALLAIGREAFGAALARPAVWAFWWPRFVRVAEWFIAQQQATTAAESRALATEVAGCLRIAAPAGPVTLRAKADRIDRAASGALAIIDYKTGILPPVWQVESGLEPQLPLEAAIAQAGGFGAIGAAGVAELAYWQVSGGDPAGRIRPLKCDVGEAAASALAGLAALVRHFDDPSSAYPACPDPARVPRFSDYGHLARIKEWASQVPGES